MNYFVILPLMRFIFNNCNNYFIKRGAVHYGYLAEVWICQGFSLRALILPHSAPSFLELPLKFY